jgi:hypothetical protein
MKFLLKNSCAALTFATSLICSVALYAQGSPQDPPPDSATENPVATDSTGASLERDKQSPAALLVAGNGAAESEVNESGVAPEDSEAATNEPKPPKAENINLQDVIVELEPATELEPAEAEVELPLDEASSPTLTVPQPNQLAPAPESVPEEDVPGKKSGAESGAKSEVADPSDGTPAKPVVPAVAPVDPEPQVEEQEPVIPAKVILGVEVPPNTSTRLVWTPGDVVSGLAERTPVLVVNGKNPGKTLCLTGAVHGDELNGIEMIRRIMYRLKPEDLSGTVIGVPVVNLMGFRRNSRYLPDRRDLNRYFPGNTHGSSASRIAHSFFTNIIRHCDALVDIHTGSFHRTNLTQLRADLSNEQVAELAQSFGVIAVLNSRGNSGSLRSAAVRAGIPSVTVEAGEPMRMQSDVVAEGTKAIETLLAKMGLYGRTSKWSRQAPVYYKSVWVRSDQSGILFSRAPLGKRIVKGEVLGTVTDPITNERSDVVSPYQGRILGMALDQVVLPGFAAYHIGIQTPEAILIEEGLLGADDDGDDAPVQNNVDSMNEPGAATTPQDSMDDEEE